MWQYVRKTSLIGYMRTNNRIRHTTHDAVWLAQHVRYTYLPKANVTKFGSVSAARMNVNNPIIPNWSKTMCLGILVMVPKWTANNVWQTYLGLTIHAQERNAINKMYIWNVSFQEALFKQTHCRQSTYCHTFFTLRYYRTSVSFTAFTECSV